MPTVGYGDEIDPHRRAGVSEEGTFMSDGNTGVPHIVTAALDAGLPGLVTAEDYEACPVTQAVRMLGDKWTLLVLVLLAERAHRFNELHRRVDGISQRMLTRTLRSLEDDGRGAAVRCDHQDAGHSPEPRRVQRPLRASCRRAGAALGIDHLAVVESHAWTPEALSVLAAAVPRLREIEPATQS
jgi:hypothetical protein